MTILIEGNVIEESVTDELLTLLTGLDDAWYIDREFIFPNMDLDGIPAKYDCLVEGSFPEELTVLLDKVRTPDTIEVIVNRYQEGMHIPRHHDKGVNKLVSCVTLSSEHDVVIAYDSEDNAVSIPDKAGQMYTISCDVEHEVTPVKSLRFSIILLRGDIYD